MEESEQEQKSTYTYISNQLIRSIAQVSNPKYPMFRMLRGVCKLFELTEIEVVHWGILNDLNKWDSNSNQQIKLVAFHSFKDFLQLIEVDNVAQYKRLLLYITLTAYHTKIILNRNLQQDFLKRMELNISSFIKLDTFMKLYNIIKKGLDEISGMITIEMINQKYQDFRAENEMQASVQATEKTTDYNQLVEQIIQMAPAYSKDEPNQNQQQKIKRIKKMKKSVQKKEEIGKRILSSQRKDDQLSNIEQLSQQQISYLEDANIVSNFVNQMITSNQLLRLSGTNIYQSNEQLNFNSIGSKKLNLIAEQFPRQIDFKRKSYQSSKE